MSDSANKVAQQALDYLLQHYQPQLVFLYGSFADAPPTATLAQVYAEIKKSGNRVIVTHKGIEYALSNQNRSHPPLRPRPHRRPSLVQKGIRL